MSPRRTTSSLALTATAALLVSAVSLVAGPVGSASAADPLPAGATLEVLDLVGTATPGQVLGGSVLLTGPDNSVDRDLSTPGLQGDGDTARDALANQVVTLSTDHGFFTAGPALPTTVGSPAGNLVSKGTATTVTTDTAGRAGFGTGIARDGGFDDDGLVSSVVTAQVGSVTGRRSAAWSSASPLNGGSVEVVLSPAERQPAAVAPAVTSDRTYYDVVTRDQFGNPVAGAPVDLGFSGKLDDFDYSEDFVESDLTRDGDFWVVSFVPGTVTVTGYWSAPSTVWTDANGASGPNPVQPAEITGSADASFYDIAFGASSFAITPSTPGDSPVGTTITETVTVVDQRGNPVEGFDVQFFRFGPASGSAGEKTVERTTNARGQASYSFVGTDPGVAKVTAVVSDQVRSRTLVNEVGFKHVTAAQALKGKVKDLPRLKGKAKKAAAKAKAKGKVKPTDVVEVRGDDVAIGAQVDVFRLTKGALRAVGPKSAVLGRTGSVTVAVRDRNGKRPTTYVAVVRATSTTFGATSAPAVVR